MKPRRFKGPTMQKVQAQIRATLGDEALIYSTRNDGDGVEIIAGLATPIPFDPALEMTDEFGPLPDGAAPPQQFIENLNAQLRLMDEKVARMSDRLSHPDADLLAAPDANFVQLNPVLYHLRKLGFQGKFCKKFAKSFLRSREMFGPFDHNDIENGLLSYLQTPMTEIYARKRICALVGPNGVGKTTSVVKLAKRYINQMRNSRVGIISTDYCDLVSKHQLSYYAQALRIPLAYANNVRELTIALHEMRDMDFILIDTYGVGQRDRRNLAELRDFLESQQDEINTYITLPCSVQEPILDEIARAFSTINTGGCILTRQDECVTLAPALSICMHYQLPINYVCNGPNVFTDIEKAENCFLLNAVINEATPNKKNAEADLQANMRRIAANTNEVSYE